MENLSDQMIERLKKLARKNAWFDVDGDLLVDDYAGGNVEDAYLGGERDGEIQLARDILNSMGISWRDGN